MTAVYLAVDWPGCGDSQLPGSWQHPCQPLRSVEGCRETGLEGGSDLVRAVAKESHNLASKSSIPWNRGDIDICGHLWIPGICAVLATLS